MTETRWAVVSKADRAGQRPRGWPQTALWVQHTEAEARRRLRLTLDSWPQLDLEVVEVCLRAGDWPMWIQVGSDVSD